MLQLVPLPITWLGFYVLGRVFAGSTLLMRHYAIVAASFVVLLSATGLKTCAFYIALGMGIVLVGYILRMMGNGLYKKLVFILSIAAMVLMIVAFLKWRIYFQKFFVYLPSLSYLGFRGIAYLTSVYRRGNVDFSAALMQMFFFPILIMGPISRVENFEKECEENSDVMRRLTMGLAMLIAGHFCGMYVVNDLRFVANVHWATFWLGAFANSFEFYFTFAGYSHLIIGLGLLTGFKIPENFNNQQ